MQAVWHAGRLIYIVTFIILLLGHRQAIANNLEASACADRTGFTSCSEIAFNRNETLSGIFDDPFFIVSDAAGPATIVNGMLAVNEFGFTPPTQGLDADDPFDFFASNNTTSPIGVPTDTFTLEQRGKATINAMKESPTSGEAQGAVWGNVTNTQIQFNGPSSSVDIEFTYSFDGAITTPTGAGSSSEPGFADLFGAFTISDPAEPMSMPLVEYSGSVFVDRKASPEDVFSVLGEWKAESLSEVDISELDTIDIDDDADNLDVDIDVLDTFTATLPTGQELNLESQLSGGIFGQIFSDGFESGDTVAWSSRSPNTGTLTITVLTPGATMTVGTPIPEPASLACLLMGGLFLAFARGRRRK